MDQQKTVLIVEDEKNIVDILRFNLQREGYQTAEAYDGEDGLEKALAGPDLILLDVMLPKMNGFDVCRALREKGSSVPVIILTAREEEADKVLGLEIGADDYITKPFSMRELMARVKANIRRTAMQRSGSADAAMAAWDEARDGARTFPANDRRKARQKLAAQRAETFILDRSTLTPPPAQPVLAET